MLKPFQPEFHFDLQNFKYAEHYLIQHWPPVIYRVQLELLLLIYKALDNQVPEYIKEFLLIKSNTTHCLHSETMASLQFLVHLVIAPFPN